MTCIHLSEVGDGVGMPPMPAQGSRSDTHPAPRLEQGTNRVVDRRFPIRSWHWLLTELFTTPCLRFYRSIGWSCTIAAYRAATGMSVQHVETKYGAHD